METTFKKYWPILIAIVGAGAGVFGWIYNQGAESKSLEGRVFDSPDQKVYVVKKVEDALTPEQEQRKYFMDSINNAHAIKAREERLERERYYDSLRKKNDSIMLDVSQRNADQIYQIKQILGQ